MYDKSGEIVVSILPLLLGEELDKQVQLYVQAMHDGKGTVTITGFEAIVQHYNKMLTHDNNGGLTIHWTRSVLEQMNFVRRKATTAAKIEPLHFDEMKEQYRLDIKAMVVIVKYSSELVFKWIMLGLILSQGQNGPWSRRNLKRVELAGLNDKYQIKMPNNSIILCITKS